MVMHSEINKLALELTDSKHPTSVSVGNFNDGIWKHIDPSQLSVTPRILTGGPSCKPFSASGKKEGGQNPLASQLCDTADMAHHLAVDAVLLENVDLLLTEDHIHGQMSLCVGYFKSKGFHLVNTAQRQDSAFGGFTSRKRVFLWFESARLTELLPPAPPLLPPPRVAPCSIRQLLYPVEDIPRSALVKGTFEPVSNVSPVPPPSSLLPTKVGFLHITDTRVSTGSLVSLKSDSKVKWKWRVLEVKGNSLVLLLTDRLHPRRLVTRSSNVKKVWPQKVPLFSIDGKSHSPRTWGEPPVDKVMMIWDTRLSPPRARPLLGEECWRVMSLPSKDIHTLLSLGASKDDIGALAGNSIPAPIIVPSAAPLVDRIRAFDALTAAKSNSKVPIMNPFAPAPCEKVCRVVLFIVSVAKPAAVFMASDGCSLPAADVPLGTRSSMVELATKWASSILGPQASGYRIHGFLAAEYTQALPRSPECIALVVVPTQCLPLGAVAVSKPAGLHRLGAAAGTSNAPAFIWASIGALAGADIHPMAATALFRVLSLTGSHCNYVQPRAWTTGALALAPADPRSVYVPTKVLTWSRCLDQMAVARDQACHALLHASGPPALQSYLSSWVDRWTPLTLSEVPPALRTNIPSFDHDTVRKLPFSRPCEPPTTAPFPKAVAQRPVKNFKPTVLSDLLMPEAIRIISRWVKRELARLTKIKMGADPGANPAVAIGQDLFHPQARGKIWDLRSIEQGSITLLDYTADISTHLNRKFFSEQLKSFPDQELLSFIEEGVSFKADLDLQIVLQPHLLSLAKGFKSVQSELERLSGKGWYNLFPSLPFVPLRLCPQGSTPRKYEDRWRRTTDGGAPRRDLLDSEGRDVTSLNNAANEDPRPDPLAPPKWPKEAKPSMADAMHDTAILRSAADAAGEPVFCVTDDFADFFNQLALRPSELWKACLITIPFDPQRNTAAVFVSEQVLGFGLSPASNIAQRWAYAIMHLLTVKMDESEALFPPKPGSPLQKWSSERAKLLGPSQGKFYFTHMYTDDPIMVVIGVDRMVRLLAAWHWLTTSMNAITAVAKKRNLGCSAKWLGSQICTTLGASYIPPDKSIRAIAALNKATQATLTIEEWRSLLGLLEHLMWVKSGQRQFMYGMYSAFVEGGQAQFGPAHIYRPTRLVINQCKRWIKIIASAGGCFFSHSLPHASSPPHAEVQYFLSSDAAKEGAPVPGLGGWAHGMWWELAIDERELLLPIAVLEFVAAAVNFITFAPFLRSAKAVVAEVDSLATAYALTQQSSKSPLMVHVHNLLLADPSFDGLKQRLHVAHIYGDGNIMADAASRGMPDVLKAVAAQLNVKLTKVEVPVAARRILTSVADYAGENGLLMKPRTAYPPRTPTPAPPSSPQLLSHHTTPSSERTAPKMVRTPGSAPPPRLRARAGCELQVGQEFPSDVPLQYLDSSPPRLPHTSLMRILGGGDLGVSPTRPTITAQSRSQLVPYSTPSIRFSLTSQAPAAQEEKPPPRLPTAPSYRQPLASELGLLQGKVDELAAFISSDTSRYALRPSQPDLVLNLCKTSLEYVQLGSAVRTHYQEDSQWRHWHAYCCHMKTPPLRSDIPANLGIDAQGQQREVLLLAGALPFFLQRMRGRTQSGKAKPRSAYAILLGVRRFHKRLGIKMVPFDLVLAVLKGLLREYIATHGPESLIPHRKEPLTVNVIRGMLGVPSGAVINGAAWDWNSPLGITLAAIFTTLAATAFRKDEIAISKEGAGSLVHVIMRSALRWSVNGTILAVDSPEVLGSIRVAVEEGKKVFPILTAPPSKADQFGEYWSASPIYLPPVSSDPLNAGARLLHLEVMLPCSGTLRASNPLFPSGRGAKPLTYKTLDTSLRGLLCTFMPPSEAARYSFHSFRIFLACALLASGASRSQIQSLCRWRGDSSVDIYARINPEDYVELLDKALRADVSSIRATNLPVIDRTREVADLQEFLASPNGRQETDNPATATRPVATPNPQSPAMTAAPLTSPPSHRHLRTPISPAARAPAPHASSRSPGSAEKPSRLKKLVGTKLIIPQSEWPNEPDAPWEAVVTSVRYNGARRPSLWCDVYDKLGAPTKVSFSTKQVGAWRRQ